MISQHALDCLLASERFSEHISSTDNICAIHANSNDYSPGESRLHGILHAGKISGQLTLILGVKFSLTLSHYFLP